MSTENTTSVEENNSKRRNAEAIKDKPYCDPSKRMDFVLFFEVHQGNPNGDPDAGNLPRVDPTDNHGIVTDVATKRKIRDYLQAALGRTIFIQNKTALNTLYVEAARDLQKSPALKEDEQEEVESIFAELSDEVAKSGKKKEADLSKKFLELLEANTPAQPEGEPTEGDDEESASFVAWLGDLEANGLETISYEPSVRRLIYSGDAKDAKGIRQSITEAIPAIPKKFEKAVSALCALIAKAAKGGGTRKGKELVKRDMCRKFDDIRLFGAVLTAGTNAGQIRGPMQLTFARSLKPIIPIESSITRIAITKASDFLRKQTEMGRKPWVSWAAYEQNGFYNAPLGASPDTGGTGVTKNDLARFWEAIANMFSEAKSAANGLMNVCDLIVFVHDDGKGRGCAPFHLLRKKIILSERDGITEFTKGFDQVYKPVIIESEEKLKGAGVSVYRPLKDLWPDL